MFSHVNYRYLVVGVLFVLTLSACSKETETEWGIYNEPIESVELPQSAGLNELSVIWEREVGETGDNGYAILRPAIDTESVYVVNRKGETLRIDAGTGDIVWEQDIDDLVFTGVGLGEGLALLALDTGRVVALDTESGEEVWRTAINRQISAVPAAGSGRVVVRTADGLLVGLESSSGDTVWSIQRAVPGLTVHGDSLPLIDGDTVITGLSSGKLIANSVINGREFWETDLSFVRGSNELERLSDVDTPPIVINSNLFTATYQGDVVSVNLQSSSVNWRADISTRLPLSVTDNKLFITDELGGIHCLDADTGKVLWNQPDFRGRGISNPLGIEPDLINGRDGRLVIGDADGNLHLLDAGTGNLLETRRVSRGAIISLAPSTDGFITFSSRGGVTAMTLTVG